MNQRTAHNTSDATETRLVSMVIYPGVLLLDVSGPLEVFDIANHIHREHGGEVPPYRTEILAEKKEMVIKTASGVRLISDAALSAKTESDTLLVAGGPMAETAPDSLVDRLRLCAPHCRRVGSICTGANLLARAGLLSGRRATTHWQYAERLQQLYPDIAIKADAIYIKDGPVYTSAGVTAGIDLVLALVEEDLGRVTALNVARRMVLYFKRPGGQSQFSTSLLSQYDEKGPLSRTIHWIRDNYHHPLPNEVLADHAAMSLRNFARVFKRETGLAPARFVEKVRLEAAVKLLEQARLSLESIAQECGFQSGEHLRLAFTRRFSITPSEYRNRFRTVD
jgi:transcriptional regulator GlxA family with amidase domain